MVIKSVNLETVCGPSSKLPENLCPEFAFAGKSNVGKSSLINGLMNRKAYARVSAQPGKTQTINYYKINSEFYLVDLPGYGFAKVSESEKARWGKLIERYLRTSSQLQLVFLLVDIRHEPSANDRQMFDWIINSGFEPVIIATKADKVKKNQLKKQTDMIRKVLGMRPDEVLIPYSSLTKQGRDEIYELLDQIMSPVEDNAEEEHTEE